MQAIQQQEIREPYSKASQDALYDSLSTLALQSPPLVLDRLKLIDSEAQRDRLLKLGFMAAVTGDREAASRYLPLVVDRPWISETSFPNACLLAKDIESVSPDLAGKLLWSIARKNPEAALRNTAAFADLALAPQFFDRLVRLAPDEAVALAARELREPSGVRHDTTTATTPTREIHESLAASSDPAVRLLATLAADRSVDAPHLRRVALLYQRIASGQLTVRAATLIAASFPRYFDTLVAMRLAPDPSPSVDRALEIESLSFCQAFSESPRTLAPDLAGLSPRNLYLLLAYGRAEANEPIFHASLDRLHDFAAVLAQTHDLKLRDFVAAVISVHRLDAFLRFAGPDVLDRLARGIDQADDRLQAAVTVAEVIDGVAGHPAAPKLAAAVAAEYARATAADDRQSQALYGLLAARVVQSGETAPGIDEIAKPYLPFLTAADRFDTATLFDHDNLCIERHFFYDDEDGIESYESFLDTYGADPAWKIEEKPGYTHITGAGPTGRRIEIYANVPLNRREEVFHRQQAITDALTARGLVATLIVHRGHSFHTQKTIRYVNSTAKLVFLGSCGGVTDVHSVIERSRDAQVIATRGVGTTPLNDAILKSLSDVLLRGDPTIDWAAFWRAQGERLGHNAMFRDYFAPHQDTASVLLRAYFQCLK